MASSFSRSSPNFPENGVARLSEASYLIDILHKISISGAYFLIFSNSSMESAVVIRIPFEFAHAKSS